MFKLTRSQRIIALALLIVTFLSMLTIAIFFTVEFGQYVANQCVETQTVTDNCRLFVQYFR
jgi:hypothetical protein